MLLKKYVKTRRKVKILLLVTIVALIVITCIILLGTAGQSNAAVERLLDERFIARAYQPQPQGEQKPRDESAVALLQPQRKDGVIVPEKYDEQKIKSRIMQNRLQQIKQQQQRDNEADQARTTLDAVATAVHIFYTAPVPWYKSKKPPLPAPEHPNEVALPLTTPKPVKILNTAFYPALGLYKPSAKLLAQHFENIRSCGIGVLILSFGKPSDSDLLHQIIELAPQHNLSVTFELSVAGNRTVEYLRQQLQEIAPYVDLPGFYRIWSQSRAALLPVLYVSNAYKLSESLGRLLCRPTALMTLGAKPEASASEIGGLRRVLDALFIGHIRCGGRKLINCITLTFALSADSKATRMCCVACASMASIANYPAMAPSLPAPGRIGHISSHLHCPTKCSLCPRWVPALRNVISFHVTEIYSDIVATGG